MTELLKIKKDFNIVKNSRDDIINIFQTLKSKMDTLKKLYKNMIITHKQSQYTFGIDSFYFQNKLLEMECDNMNKIFNAIDNRMYCEYYKLHMIIQDFINKEVDDEILRNKITIRKKYPPYKNLQPLKVYGFKLVNEIQELTINTIIELESYRLAKDNELENDNTQSVLGLNIGNLVNSYRYSNAVLKEKIRMFSGYLETFHEHHTKYLYRLSVQLKLILKIINEDIRIKQFNQLDTTSKDNVIINLKKTPQHKNIIINNNIVKNDNKILIEEHTKENDLNENMFLNQPNSINLSDDTLVGRNSVMTDNTDIESIISDISVENNISQKDIGKRVAVEGYDSIGTLRFYGKHAVKSSMRCGVEFDEPVGKHNGTIYGHEYFKSVENRGVLVVPRKVAIINNDEEEQVNDQVLINEQDQINEHGQVSEQEQVNEDEHINEQEEVNEEEQVNDQVLINEQDQINEQGQVSEQEEVNEDEQINEQEEVNEAEQINENDLNTNKYTEFIKN